MIKLLAIDLDRTCLDSTDTVPASAMEALKEANTIARKILRLTVRVDGEVRKA